MVLIIVALMSMGLMVGISAQRSVAENSDVQLQLENIREALLGYAMTNGRLPCPADPTLQSDVGGNEALESAPTGTAADKVCTLEFGVLPWKTLGISEADPWGNRFTYLVGFEFSNPLTEEEKNNGMRAKFDLTTTGRANIEDGASHTVAGDVPAVIVSHGKKSAGAYNSAGNKLENGSGDEKENSDADLTFVSKVPNDAFDDIVTWIVPTILKSRMVAAGRLP